VKATGVAGGGDFRARRALALIGLALLIGSTGTVRGVENPAPVLLQSTPGRFEIAAIQSETAGVVAAEANDAWRYLAVPLALPDAFASPIFVRVVPAADWRGPEPFRVALEPGVVSLWLSGEAARDRQVARRALVRALLMRLAVAQRGVIAQVMVPPWLEVGVVNWWSARAAPAVMDAFKQESIGLAPPGLDELLAWQAGQPEPRSASVGSYWLLSFLMSESSRAGEWSACVSRLLAGDEPLGALAASFPGRFATADERELWWQTGWHALRRVRTLPVLDAAESHDEIAALARFVFARDERDEVVPLEAVLAHGAEPAVRAELARRSADVARLVPALHPFFRNAGLSLGEALASRPGTASRRAALGAAFEQDWRDAIELEAATRRALDQLEQSRRPARVP
jgi:hypothetical protein